MGVNEFIQIGSKIKKLRLEKGISQKEMSKMCEIPYSTYSNYENNNREPGTEQLITIAKALNVTMEELIAGHTLYDFYPPPGISEDHPVAFPGLEKKLSELGCYIRYGCDYPGCDENAIWIDYPTGERVFISIAILNKLDSDVSSYLAFQVDRLKGGQPQE